MSVRHPRCRIAAWISCYLVPLLANLTLNLSDGLQLIDFTGEPGGTRTRDPVIKSHMLYQLSYRP